MAKTSAILRVEQPVLAHDPVERDGEEGGRDQVGQERGVGDEVAEAQRSRPMAKLARLATASTRAMVPSATSTLLASCRQKFCRKK